MFNVKGPSSPHSPPPTVIVIEGEREDNPVVRLFKYVFWAFATYVFVIFFVAIVLSCFFEPARIHGCDYRIETSHSHLHDPSHAGTAAKYFLPGLLFSRTSRLVCTVLVSFLLLLALCHFCAIVPRVQVLDGGGQRSLWFADGARAVYQGEWAILRQYVKGISDAWTDDISGLKKWLFREPPVKVPLSQGSPDPIP